MRIKPTLLGIILISAFLAHTVVLHFEDSVNAVAIKSHDADSMWVEPSPIFLFEGSNASVGTRFNVTVWLNMTEDIGDYQVGMLYNRTQLSCTRAGYTAGATSNYFAGHATVSPTPVIDTFGALGNGSVVAFETCVGMDYISGPHNGSLFWAEFQILIVPTSGSLVSKFDISREYGAELYTWVFASDEITFLPFTSYDGIYECTVQGPRMDSLVVKFYNGATSLYNALKNGDVDLTDSVLSSAQMQDAFNDTNIRTATSSEDYMYEFDFNNNATTPTYPNWTNPTAYKGFRQAIACLVDKTQFVNSLNYSTRIDTPISRPFNDWWVDWSVSQYDSSGNSLGNYPYEYNSTAAAHYFDQSGFVQGNTTNPYYDNSFPSSAEFLRVYPVGHPKSGQDLDPLIFIIRNDDPIRLQAGRILRDNLRKMGIPINATELNSANARPEVMYKKNYHIYTGAWSDVGIAPSWIEPGLMSLPGFLDVYSSEYILNDTQVSQDYPQFRNATYDGSLNTLKLDYPTDLASAKNAALACQEILIQEAVCAWLCSPSMVMGYRFLSGVTDPRGGRIDNQWTFLKASSSRSDSTIYYGLLNAPSSLNVITDGDMDCLDRIYDTLLSYSPYDEAIGNIGEGGDRLGTMPWLAKDWDVGLWASPYTIGSNLTKLTFYLRDSVRWHDGVELNSTDVKFTIDYLQTLKDVSWLSEYVSDVDHVTTPDARTVVVYENVSNAQTLGYIGKLPILPEHIFQSIGQNVTGFTPGADAGYSANQTLIGCGPWKFLSYNSSMLCLQANRDYFMETPPEADVDLRYDWKLGCWAVDAMDATMVGEALGSSGIGGLSARWEPGCDLNGDGIVNMTDLTTVRTEFNETWGASATRSFVESPACSVYVELAQNSILLGQNLTAYVKLRNLDKLSGFQFKLNYDNSMLNCLTLGLSPIFLPNNTQAMESVVNQTLGLIWVCNTTLASAQQVSGNVTLATITFNSTEPGSSALHLWDTELARFGASGSACQPMPHQEVDAGVTIGVSTPAGTNVKVTPAQNVGLTFANVTNGGFTTLNTTQPPTPQFVSVVCDKIETNATYTGSITLQLGYNAAGISAQEQQAMKIWLWNDSSECWLDITSGVNTTSHFVYGISPHLSMFGITCNLGISGDLGVTGTTTVSIPSAPPAPPHRLAALNYYQINTTKSLMAPINLSLAYNYGNIPPGEEIFTQMWMWNESSASWVDITTGVNTADHIVYGSAPHLSMFGITSLPQPPNGITVASANCPKTVVFQGYGANINVTVCNQGDFPQTNFDVTLFCNTTLLATYHIDQLNSQGQIILNFTWNTTGWAKCNYSVSTCSDNIGWIRVSMVGDLTGGTSNVWDFVPDGKCDGKDISVAAKCFGSYPACSPPQIWNANCDVNDDGKVDGKDIAIVAKHFGQADS